MAPLPTFSAHHCLGQTLGSFFLVSIFLPLTASQGSARSPEIWRTVVSGSHAWGLPWRSNGQESHTSTAGGTGSIPGWGTKIPHAVQRGQEKKKKKSHLYLLFLRTPKIHLASFLSSGLAVLLLYFSCHPSFILNSTRLAPTDLHPIAPFPTLPDGVASRSL